MYIWKRALNQVKSSTYITFECNPIYGDSHGQGRKPVEQVEFEVFYKPKPEAEPATPLPELPPDQAAKVLAVYSVEVINRQLYDIHTKAADGKVKNLGSYTAKVIG